MSLSRIAWLAGLTLVYFAAGKLGLSLAFTHASASAVWPPAGVALGALLVVGRDLWPAVLLGAFLVNVSTTGDVPSSLGIAVGNTLEAVVGAWLVHRVAGGPAALRRAEGVFRFAGLAVPIPAAIAATVGVTSLALSGLAERAALPSIWLTWWLGDTVGAIVVAPLIILWASRPRLHRNRGAALEAVLLLAAVILTAFLLFRGLILPLASGYPLAFLALPTLLWAAFRFGERETVTVSALLSAFAIWGTLDGFGPFASLPPEQSLVVLQAFIGVVTVAMLAAAAEVGGRSDSDAALVRLNQDLEARVASRTELLERTQARLIEAQQVAHIGSWEWDITNDSLWWSEELYRMYGVEPASFAASYEGFLAMVHPDDRALVESTVSRALRTGQPFSFDHRVVRTDGAVRRMYGRGRVVVDPDGRPTRMLGIGQDITERLEAEQERAKLAIEQTARREAEAANEAKDQFLALLSHELRTPVNAVMGWAHLLIEGRLEEGAHEKAIAAIYRNARIQAGLVSDLLDASRIRAGTLRLDLDTLDLAIVVGDAVESIRPMAISKDIRVVIDVAPVSMVGDAERLGQVIRNLLLNSVKFASSGGQVSLTSRAIDGHVRITVEDDGPGISADFLPHLFEQFRQADPSMTREHQGLGLGLAIVRQIVTLHGGAVEAANRAGGVGAVFTVHLPLTAPAPLAADDRPR
jgi:PAS domain S-box-containing protein